MPTARWFSPSWVGLVASCAASLGACTSYIAKADDAGDAAAPDALGSDAAANNTDADARVGNDDAGPSPPAGCLLDTPNGIGLECLDAAFGVFVRAGATLGDGSKQNPFGTVTEAIGALGERKSVFVATGTYDETLRLADRSISIFGGFSPTFDDAAPRFGLSTFTGTTGYALEVSGGQQRMRFEDLVLRAPDTPDRPTPFSVAVFVHRAGSENAPVTFRRVRFIAAPGGDMAAPAPVPASPTCDVDGPGACSSATAMGGAGAAVGHAAAPGAPAADGGGAAGTNPDPTCAGGSKGGAGNDRTAVGMAGSVGDRYALSDSGLVAVAAAAGSPGQQGAGGGGGGAAVIFASVGGVGGCGGCGGLGGASGNAGALSVALVVAQSPVSLEGCTLRADDGGTGGDGQSGGAGGPGRPGASGTGPADCWKAGGEGGHGGPGGAGAGGAGGSSMCILHDSTASVDAPDLTCAVGLAGSPGSGKDGAPSGPAGIAVAVALLDEQGHLSPAP